jgi:hypothetical protein
MKCIPVSTHLIEVNKLKNIDLSLFLKKVLQIVEKGKRLREIVNRD